MTAYRISFNDEVHWLEQKTIADAQRGAAYLWPSETAEVREATAEEYAALVAPRDKVVVERHLQGVESD